MPYCQMSDPKAQVSDEDQMAAALTEIREAKASGEPVQEAAPEQATSPEAAAVDTPADDPAKPEPAKAADAATAAPAAEETPEARLAKVNAELHRAQSDLGRVNALNRTNLEKSQRIVALERELQEARKSPQSPAEAVNELATLSEKVKEFPELKDLVDAVSKALKEVEGKAQAAATKAAQDAIAPLEPLRQRDLDRQAEEQTAAQAADLRTFSGTYPSAVEVIKTDDFKTWLPKQSQAIQWAFFKGTTPADALPVMDAYDAHLRRSGKQSIAHTPTTQQPLAAEHQKQPASDRLTRATGIPSRQANGAKGSLPPEDDFEGSLEFFRNKSAEERRRAAAA